MSRHLISLVSVISGHVGHEFITFVEVPGIPKATERHVQSRVAIDSKTGVCPNKRKGTMPMNAISRSLEGFTEKEPIVEGVPDQGFADAKLLFHVGHDDLWNLVKIRWEREYMSYMESHGL